VNINPGELLVLVMFAVILFGPEKLPELARKAARVIHYVRNIANDAQSQLREELGPEFANFDVRDLNPKTFVQKHLLEDEIVTDIKGEIDSASTLAASTSSELKDELDDVRADLEQARDAAEDTLHARSTVPFDPEAT